MDPASFTLAVAGLPGIFKASVDCWQYVRLGRSFGQDFGFCLAKLEAAELQYTRWGSSLGFFTDPSDVDALVKKTGAWRQTASYSKGTS